MDRSLAGQLSRFEEIYVPHIGWFAYPPDDDVGKFLAEGWFEAREQAFFWLYLRPGDVVVDAGAHAGLYTLIASAAGAQVTAIEPLPSTRAVLESNLVTHACAGVKIIPKCLGSASGFARLRVPAQGPAYSSLWGGGSDQAVDVETVSLDELGVQEASLVKLDIEGAEFQALAGAKEMIAHGRLPLWMIEFTRANLERAGSSPEQLFEYLGTMNYQVCRFTDRLELEPLDEVGPCHYENYFAVADPAEVSERLRTAPAGRRRIAEDLVHRGALSAALWNDRLKLSAAEARLADLDAAYARLGAADWDLADLRGRLDRAESEGAAQRGAAAAFSTTVQSLKAELELRASENLDLQSQLSELGAALRGMREVEEASQRRIRELEDREAETAAELLKTLSRASLLETEQRNVVAAFSATVQRLQSELELTASENTDLQSQLSEQRSALQRMGEVEEASKRKIRELEDREEQTAAQRSRALDRASLLETQLSELLGKRAIRLLMAVGALDSAK